MRVQDVMTEGIDSVAPETKADTAWETMRVNGTHHLIVKKGSDLVGVFSHRDAGGARGASLRKGRRVADLMTRGVVSVAATTPLRKAANLMRGRSIGCLVVTATRRPVGVVTISALLDVLGRGGDHGARSTRRPTLSHRVPHKKPNGVVKAW
jgi:CBS domain-containing protein